MQVSLTDADACQKDFAQLSYDFEIRHHRPLRLKKKIYEFYTAPITKFWADSVSGENEHKNIYLYFSLHIATSFAALMIFTGNVLTVFSLSLFLSFSSYRTFFSSSTPKMAYMVFLMLFTYTVLVRMTPTPTWQEAYSIAYITTLGCEKVREVISSEPVAIT